MLQIGFIRENKDRVIEGLRKRNFADMHLVHKAVDIDEERRKTQQQHDEQLAKANQLSKEIGGLYKEGKTEEANALKEETGNLKELNKALSIRLSELENELQEVLYLIPNVPNELVPTGKSADDNLEVYSAGEVTCPLEKPEPHWDIASKYDLIDFELGTKITGAGFPVYKGKGARLQRALINFFLDEADAAGYREFLPPHLVNEASGYGTGQLPDKEGQMYHVGIDNLYLIPTAEVPVTNIFRDVIVKESDLPIQCTAYTPCFRREAGSYGKDVRGLNRLHQFDKVEIVQIAHPTESYKILDEMVEHVKGLLNKLGLKYRIVRLCGGDMGFTSALTYDFEVYSCAQERWLEVSSVSNFETFQANRMKLRYKDSNGKIHLAHTLNGSALALPRVLAALLENNQTENGVVIPECLLKYTGFDVIN